MTEGTDTELPSARTNPGQRYLEQTIRVRVYRYCSVMGNNCVSTDSYIPKPCPRYLHPTLQARGDSALEGKPQAGGLQET